MGILIRRSIRGILRGSGSMKRSVGEYEGESGSK